MSKQAFLARESLDAFHELGLTARILLVESPLAFRRRPIFVSANALSRPRENSRRDA
jgi:hypothetical protein